MSKKHQKSQADICSYIFDDYVFNRDLTSSSDVLKNIDLLIDNNLATKVTGIEDVTSAYQHRYKIACMFMIENNKDLKKFIRRKRTSQYYEIEAKSADSNPDLVKLYDMCLENGIYYAVLGDKDHDDYAILKASPSDQDDVDIVSYELYFVGYKHMKYKDKFFNMVDEYEKKAKEKKDEGITYADGRPFKSVKFKSFDQMIFNDKDRILNYIDKWVNSIPKYYKYGITPKLSILLYGEPGTGKSTFCKALAKYLGLETVKTIPPSFFSSEDDTKTRYSNYRYNGFVVAIDDIDCVCKSREEDSSNDNGKILSNLLEYLDNPDTFYYKAKDGLYYPISIVVATTNYYDRLDDAVKRYGRFDLKLEMNIFNEEEARAMCNIYELELEDVYKEPINKDFKISPAYLQAVCLENIDKNIKGERK